MLSSDDALPGITEDEIAEFLANTPDFFERHAALLAAVELRSPHGMRAVSLQERQMEMLRERIKGLEHRMIEMIRNGQENQGLADRLHRWTCRVMLTSDRLAVPERVISGLQDEFLIPRVALRVWDVDADCARLPCAQAVSAEVRDFARTLKQPYCGPNSRHEAAAWFVDAHQITSIALLPLRRQGESFGLLALGSPDPTRFSADMGVDLLERVTDIASAGLARLLP